MTISYVLLGAIPSAAAVWQGTNALGHPGVPGDWLSWLLTAVAMAALVALCWAFARWVLAPFDGEAATDPRFARAMRRLRVGVAWLGGAAVVWAGVVVWVTMVNASCPPPPTGASYCGLDETVIAVLLVFPVVMVSTAVAVALVLSARHRATVTIADESGRARGGPIRT